MSTPDRPHLLQRELDKGAGGIYVPARYSQMRCDGGMGLCTIPPARAPRLIVPPKPFVPDVILAPRRVWMTLHYCERHVGELTVEQVLGGGKIKADIEAVCKAKWSQEYRPDFDAAYIRYYLVTAPEYRDFLLKLERGQRRSAAGDPVL